jgi:hypothetical protein
MALTRILASPIHGGGEPSAAERTVEGASLLHDVAAAVRSAETEVRPLHHSLFASLGERSPSPASQGKQG